MLSSYKDICLHKSCNHFQFISVFWYSVWCDSIEDIFFFERNIRDWWHLLFVVDCWRADCCLHSRSYHFRLVHWDNIEMHPHKHYIELYRHTHTGRNRYIEMYKHTILLVDLYRKYASLVYKRAKSQFSSNRIPLN